MPLIFSPNSRLSLSLFFQWSLQFFFTLAFELVSFHPRLCYFNSTLFFPREWLGLAGGVIMEMRISIWRTNKFSYFMWASEKKDIGQDVLRPRLLWSSRRNEKAPSKISSIRNRHKKIEREEETFSIPKKRNNAKLFACLFSFQPPYMPKIEY